MEKIYFIGIGGIGISALAQYYLAKGYKIIGSDLQKSEITEFLSKKGVKIFIGQKAKNLSKDTSLVIYTSAIPNNNPELKKARACGITVQSYAKVLGDLTKQYFTIAVSGSHGKSTTTAMISLILMKAGFNPTVIIGTKLKEFGNTNFRMGGRCAKSKIKQPILVIEACEYEEAFLNYWPKIIVVTNIEREHLDYFLNLRNIIAAFRKFISHLPQTGYLIVNQESKNIKKILRVKKIKNIAFSSIGKRVIYFSLKQKEESKFRRMLQVPGDYNIQNALAALITARVLNITDRISFKALSEYKGAWRRFEIFNAKLRAVNYKLVSDYAHHPTEVKASLSGAKEKFPQSRIILVFQPHQFERTKIFFKDFVKSFDDVDYLILNEIYGVAGREKEKGISSKDLAFAIQKRWKKMGYKNKTVKFFKTQDSILKEISTILKKRDIVIVMGAGNIYDLTLKLLLI